jgi:hypothetical protein
MLKPTKPIPDVAIVSCLIDELTGTWIPESLYALFDKKNCRFDYANSDWYAWGADFVRWPHTRNDIYSVRSAYNLSRSSKFFAARSKRGRGMSSAMVDEEKEWKSLWKIKAPGKMKINLWRFAHDCLPSGAQLRRRQIPANDACVFCGRDEDVEHAFLQCTFAREVWHKVKETFSFRLARRDFMSPKTWLFAYLSRATHLEATILAVGCWYIWNARNDARNNQENPDPTRTSLRITAYVDMIV